jgi:malate dehydrogenase (oxaloacetate-decarboxylating)
MSTSIHSNICLVLQGLSFTAAEREELHLTGLLPPAVQTPETQIKRLLAKLKQCPNEITKYEELFALHVSFSSSG